MPSGTVLPALAVIAFGALCAGRVATALRQPAVVGELLLGVALGPTLLGGRLGHALLPASDRPTLSGFGTVGLVLFMFLVGLGLEPSGRGRSRATVAVATGTLALPLVAGFGVGLALYSGHRTAATGRTGFALFVGLAFSVTAFPVLARILRDRDLDDTATGRLALSAAGLADAAAWALLAAVLAVAGVHGGHPVRLIALVPLALALGALRRLPPRLTPHTHSPAELALVLGGLIGCAAATEWMGLQPVLGAFAFGLALPRKAAAGALAVRLRERIAPITFALLLPIYFVLSGLHVDLRHVPGRELVLVLLLATTTKFAGTLIAARLSRLDWRPALTLAILLDTRGLTEIVVLGIGRQDGIIDSGLYTIMVTMAILTTVLTSPLLSLVDRGARRRGDLPRPQPAARPS